MATPPTDGEFTATAFAEHWRNAEPQLRRGVVRFGVAPEDVDDLLAEVALRMFRARVDRPTLREFVRFAEAVARNIVMKRQEADSRTRRRLRERPPIEHADESEAMEWRLAIQQAMEGGGFADLSENDRRAIELLLRGPLPGGYTTQERGVIFRARPRLRDLFDELFVGVGFGWRFLRGRLEELRNPPPAIPALAALMSAAAIGVFPASNADVGSDDSQPSPMATAVVRQASVAATPLPASPMPVAEAVEPATGPPQVNQPRRDQPSRPSQPVETQTQARLPTPDQPGRVEVIVLRPIHDGETWITAEVNCGSMTTGLACAALRTAN